jgi:hypothetical protein
MEAGAATEVAVPTVSFTGVPPGVTGLPLSLPLAGGPVTLPALLTVHKFGEPIHLDVRCHSTQSVRKCNGSVPPISAQPVNLLAISEA